MTGVLQIRLGRTVTLVMLLAVLAYPLPHESLLAATPGQKATEYLQQRFGLTDVQARGALGALLVFAREQLPKPQFDQLASRIPNAEYMMEAVKQRGVVTRPLDDISNYEESLGSLGISQELAAQIAPAVVEFLGAAGFDEEQAILSGILR
jgi:hypothetical protein